MTSGSQQSLDLTAQMLLDEGHMAGIEEPGYPGAQAAFEAVGADLVPVSVDESGVDVESAQVALNGARVLYTSPSHQYPLGVTLAFERRLAMLAWADRSGAWIIEDDYDSEFRFEARPLPSLQGLDGKQRTIYIGTFSKILAPALRLGFLVLPPPLVDAFVRAREVMDNHPPMLTQAVLAEFMDGGHLERHIARMRNVYGERREVLRDALQRAFGEHVEIVPGDAGLHLCMLLEPSVNDRRLSSRAAAAGIDVEPLSSHYLSHARRPGLILGYGAYEPGELQAAVEVLERCVEEARA
jgi:GntR family transcriptional regulator/MocR family aminotransferase